MSEPQRPFPERRRRKNEPAASSNPPAPDPTARERVSDLVEDAVDVVVDRASSVVGGAVDLAQGAVGGAVDLAQGAVGGAVDLAHGAARRWDERPGARVRRIRRLGRIPLPFLYALHPEARRASPREVGLRTIDVDRIAGTAVGGVDQRGSDFLPLRPFRSQNWMARWQRIRKAADRLAILPPIDVVAYDGRYWVLDGHNRVASALYDGQVGIDANVVELVPPGAAPSEPSGSLAAVLSESRALRTAGAGRRVSGVSEDGRTDRRSPRRRVGEDSGR